MHAELVEIQGDLPHRDLAARVLAGEVVVVRRCMQQLGLIEELREASLQGIRETAGSEVADRVASLGFEMIHECVGAEQIPAITDRVYEIVSRKAAGWLLQLVPKVFGRREPFYFEREPNVRFLIPHANSLGQSALYREFAEAHGEGKITAHGPHRDSWLDCPDNTINAWIAVGPVHKGNGLSIFADRHGCDLAYEANGSIARHESPGAPINLELAPGDTVFFHGDQLHASELNRTDETRHALSFRVTMDKPNFPNGHYHHYVYSTLATRLGGRLAEIPADFAWSYWTTRLGWIRREIAARIGAGDLAEAARPGPSEVTEKDSSTGGHSVDVSDLEVGGLRALSSQVCLARIDRERIVAFRRQCPHEGADLSLGLVRDGQVVCPWHNLPFDLEDGKSPCKGLAGLRMVQISEVEGRVTLDD
jgi:nitrite reductase/ring-hydroxylating ferredoxin subunit